MAIPKLTAHEEILALDLWCPRCHWRGKGAQALVGPDSIVCCPRAECGCGVELCGQVKVTESGE